MRILVMICSKIVEYSLFALSIGLCVIGSFQIFSRILFNYPLSWSEEVILFIFIWWAGMGAALAMKMRAHLSVDVLEGLPRRLRKYLQRMVHMFSLAFLGILVWEGMKSAHSHMMMESTMTRIPMGFIYFIIPLSSFIMIIFLIDQIRKGEGKDPEKGEGKAEE